jgi:hypothetical protein
MAAVVGFDEELAEVEVVGFSFIEGVTDGGRV